MMHLFMTDRHIRKMRNQCKEHITELYTLPKSPRRDEILRSAITQYKYYRKLKFQIDGTY